MRGLFFSLLLVSSAAVALDGEQDQVRALVCLITMEENQRLPEERQIPTPCKDEDFAALNRVLEREAAMEKMLREQEARRALTGRH